MTARTVWRWVVDALAVYRLTRLVTADGITDPIRDAVEEWANEPGVPQWRQMFSELIGCRWCTSQWAALGLVYLVRGTDWWPNMADALALSAVSTLVAGLER